MGTSCYLVFPFFCIDTHILCCVFSVNFFCSQGIFIYNHSYFKLKICIIIPASYSMGTNLLHRQNFMWLLPSGVISKRVFLPVTITDKASETMKSVQGSFGYRPRTRACFRFLNTYFNLNNSKSGSFRSVFAKVCPLQRLGTAVISFWAYTVQLKICIVIDGSDSQVECGNETVTKLGCAKVFFVPWP